jgi:hypothetical protein
MKPDAITAALTDIRAETDPTLKAQKLASLCSAAFRARGIELVVVGGSAIEFYTDGAYTSGDVDLCVLKPARPIPLRLRQEIMAELGGQGGPRSWEVAGLFVDVLGEVETLARTPMRQFQAPYGLINLVAPEELLVERVLVSVYPQPNPEARSCATQLLGVTLTGNVGCDWPEVRRLAQLPAYGILPQLKQLVSEVCDELKIQSPLDSD